jgi:chromosomal replication initiator protein
MKHDVFNQYVDRVIDLFGITKDAFFSKTKKREIVDARQLIYYLCYKRPMQIVYIQRYMNEAGYDIKHSSIIHGISAVEKRIAEDKDYLSVVKEVEKAVSI